MTLTYPLDTIRARLAFQVTGEHKYSGIVHTALSVMKNVSIVHRNFCETSIRRTINCWFCSFRRVVFVVCIVVLCPLWLEWFRMPDFHFIALKVLNFCAWNIHLNIPAKNAKRIQVNWNAMHWNLIQSINSFQLLSGGLVLNIPAKLLAGGLAGAIAQSFSYPLDVTRRRMQLAMMDPETAKFG